MASELPPIPQIVYSTTTAPVIIEAYAVRYGIPAQPLIDTLQCESNFIRTASGDFGTSFGVAQIHLPAHTDISKAQALDPIWSIDWAAQQFKAGKQSMWTCYRKLYGGYGT